MKTGCPAVRYQTRFDKGMQKVPVLRQRASERIFCDQQKALSLFLLLQPDPILFPTRRLMTDRAAPVGVDRVRLCTPSYQKRRPGPPTWEARKPAVIGGESMLSVANSGRVRMFYKWRDVIFRRVHSLLRLSHGKEYCFGPARLETTPNEFAASERAASQKKRLLLLVSVKVEQRSP